MNRDMEVRKCLGPWKNGVTGDRPQTREAVELREPGGVGAEIEKGLES